MVDILSDYIQSVELVLEENPVLTLEKILGKDRKVSPGEIIQLGIKIRKHWNKYVYLIKIICKTILTILGKKFIIFF